ncbi:choline dehydrogenase [Lindgomyces ingoldianus]|uniref:Choline dehydrogenase n=1 Tax=Lindgomyces ingoldianus TaxID=673940 RepID=A0ACB6QDH4_9PLEO|nr:choline dehydrogenase [Lindgomyces ingoldianus]KAF2465003.1 choline dehydrogenase [Lindgomyces ingoldianus]
MVFDRAAKADYDAWQDLGNPGWGWNELYPYFKKSSTFTPPRNEATSKFGYTWDPHAYGEGPIQASFPPFQWETERIMFEAWEDLNITGPIEHALGDAVGRFWMPSSIHPVNQTRSYARYGYYDPIKTRTNYHLLVGHRAEKLVLGPDLAVKGVVIYQRDRPEQRSTVTATRETILAAGAVHTPQILELSGIGSKKVLETAGIKVRIELPGVGENFQDHPQAHLVCNFTKDIYPNPTTLKENATFAAEALAEYNANKTGPYTMALSNAVAFLSLSVTHSSPTSFLSKLAAQSVHAYLRPNSSAEVIEGLKAQKRVLKNLFSSPFSAVYEAPISGICPKSILLQKPLSRGTIHINSSDPTGPVVVDWRTFSNPLDVEQAVEFIKFTRRYIATPKLAFLGPVESGPGRNVSNADTAALEAWVRSTSTPTSFHACGTTAMLPRELGGVVGSDLKVYGVKGLSVVDAGLFPLIPAAHLSATVYAVAEKAADIIKNRA